MRQETQEQFFKMLERQAELNGAQYSLGNKSIDFTVTPSVEQTMEQAIQEKADFLKEINIEGVIDLKGDKIRLGSGNTLAGRVDTDVEDRETSDPTSMDDEGYECIETNFDSHLTWKKMDQWARKTEFQPIWRNTVLEQIARDRMTIGFNGTSRAAKTNRTAHPLLQDVNIGWLQKIRDHASGSQHESGHVIGADNEFKNLDALVMAMKNDLLAPWYRNDTGLVVICGSNLVSDKYFGFVNDADNKTATNQVALKTLLSTQQLGNTRTLQVPFFPENALLVTKLDMLSIYYQEGTRRRVIENNAKRKRVEDYQSVNEDYVIEDYGCTAFIEDITEAVAA